MALIKCHECGAKISKEAKACPSCGAKPKVESAAAGWIFLILIGLYFFGKSDTVQEHAAEKSCTDQTMAFVMSQSFVKPRLKSPSSADFPLIRNNGVRTNYLGDCTHEIHAYVDSQNGFGAQIRTKYYAKLKYLKGKDEWQLLDIKFPN